MRFSIQGLGFYSLLNSFTDLVPLETPYGTFQVYVKDEIKVDYLTDGWCKIVIKFQEPVVTIPTPVLSTDTNYRVYGIDGIPFKIIGAFVVSVKDNFNRPGTKKQSVSAYGYEGYELTKTKVQKIKVALVFQADSFTDLKTRFSSSVFGRRSIDENLDTKLTTLGHSSEICRFNLRVGLERAFSSVSLN